MKNPKLIETIIEGATYRVPTYKITNEIKIQRQILDKKAFSRRHYYKLPYNIYNL